ncbi:iron-siderophore ABC transporter substrate-binding protein [Actinoplanes sp. N902-109]|uniref:iron-siderophore ABC transporter substrate-binding protein n=1 Tax=Actinoplanes sp. (strain N902-109) TaxID=649831 RepID=UPI0003293E4B|nr:iron-siderophore ABC transporter substrate-binding protein [Actinoplanes sp. N902-109]AGL20612.1 periplasmic binding protein [Actinoplanes sp. N902-109]
MRFVPSRGRRLLLAAVAATVALSACSTTGTEDDDSAAPAASGSSGAAFPVTVSTAFGDITIPKQPERVVTLGWSDAEVALALGVQPVGDADWLAFGGDGQGPWNQGKYTTPPTMVGTLEPDMEKIAALKPDLILDTRASGAKDRYDKLAALGVPVVDIPQGGTAYTTTWDQQLDMVGKALGKSAEAAKLKSDLAATFTSVAAANPAFTGKTVSAGVKTAQGWGAYVSGDGRVDFLQKLGFQDAPEVEALKKDNFYINLSQEQVGLLDADLTTIFLIGVKADEVKSDKLLQAVPSVKAGHVVYLDDPAISNAFSSNSVLGLRYALDKVPPLLAAALG